MKTLEKITLIAIGVILMAVVAFVPSCQTPQTISTTTAPSQEIHDIGTDVATDSTNLTATATTIKTNATTGQQKTPPSAMPIIGQYWSNILSAVGSQFQIANDLTNEKTRADTAEAASKKLENDYITVQSDLKKAQDNVTLELQHQYAIYSGILFFVALILFGLGIWADGNKVLLWCGGIAAAGAGVCIFLVKFIPFLPWIIGAFCLLGLGFLIYYLVKNKGKITSLTTATKELAQTVEAAKPKMTLAGRKAMFGDGPGKGEASIIQSEATEKLVQNIRFSIEKAPCVPVTIASDMVSCGVADQNYLHVVSPARPFVSERKPVVLH